MKDEGGGGGGGGGSIMYLMVVSNLVFYTCSTSMVTSGQCT